MLSICLLARLPYFLANSAKVSKAEGMDDCGNVQRLLGAGMPVATFADSIYQRKHLHLRGVGRCKGLAVDTLTSEELLTNMRRNQNSNHLHTAPLEYGSNFFFTAMRGRAQEDKESYAPGKLTECGCE